MAIATNSVIVKRVGFAFCHCFYKLKVQKIVCTKYKTFLNPLVTAAESSEKTAFSPIPILWTGFWLIGIRMAKNDEFGLFFFGESISTFLSRSLFYLLFLLYWRFGCSLLAWNCGWKGKNVIFKE